MHIFHMESYYTFMKTTRLTNCTVCVKRSAFFHRHSWKIVAIRIVFHKFHYNDIIFLNPYIYYTAWSVTHIVRMWSLIYSNSSRFVTQILWKSFLHVLYCFILDLILFLRTFFWNGVNNKKEKKNIITYIHPCLLKQVCKNNSRRYVYKKLLLSTLNTIYKSFFFNK